VLANEFEGNFMKPGYRMPLQAVDPQAETNPSDTAPVTTLNVKSVIATPGRDARLAAGAATVVRGAAWAGENDISKVEVSADGGRTWRVAQLGTQQAKYC